MTKLSAQQAKFLDENPFPGVLTTLRPDGSPHSTVVWVDVLEDGTLSFNTVRGRVKDVNLRRDPRLSLAVIDSADDYRWISVNGRAAVMTEEGADAQIDKLALKYLGALEYPWAQPGQVRVSVRIELDRVESSGIDEA